MTWGGEEGDPGCEDFTLTPTFGLLPPGGQTSIKIGFHARASKEFNRKFTIDVFDAAEPSVLGVVHSLQVELTPTPRPTHNPHHNPNHSSNRTSHTPTPQPQPQPHTPKHNLTIAPKPHLSPNLNSNPAAGRIGGGGLLGGRRRDMA